MKKNQVKADTILKNFWRNNERFADLFNAVLFEGRRMIDPKASDTGAGEREVPFSMSGCGHGF